MSSKWLKESPTILKKNDVVLLKAETLEKNQWRLAKIVETHANAHGEVTTVTIKLPNLAGNLKRSMRQVALLESVVPSKSKDSDDQEQATADGNLPKGTECLAKVGVENQPGAKAQPRESERTLQVPATESPAATDPGMEVTAANNPVPLEPPAPESNNGRPKRKRRHAGYYKTCLLYTSPSPRDS